MTTLLELSTYQINTFKTLFKILGKTLKDIIMFFHPTNINNEDKKNNTGYISICDSNDSKKMLVYLKLEEYGFIKFYCNKKIGISVDLQVLNKILKKFNEKNGDLLTMYINNEDKTNLKIIVGNDKNKTEFCFRSLYLKDEIIGLPTRNCDMGAKIIMSCYEFHKTCEEIYDFNNKFDTVGFNVQKNNFIIKCASQRNSISKQYKVDGNLPQNSANLQTDIFETLTTNPKYLPVSIDTKTSLLNSFTVQSYLSENKNNNLYGLCMDYDLNGLMAFNKLTKLSQNVEIFIDSDYPLALKYNTPLGRLYLLFAPSYHESYEEEIDEYDKENNRNYYYDHYDGRTYGLNRNIYTITGTENYANYTKLETENKALQEKYAILKEKNKVLLKNNKVLLENNKILLENNNQLHRVMKS